MCAPKESQNVAQVNQNFISRPTPNAVLSLGRLGTGFYANIIINPVLEPPPTRFPTPPNNTIKHGSNRNQSTSGGFRFIYMSVCVCMWTTNDNWQTGRRWKCEEMKTWKTEREEIKKNATPNRKLHQQFLWKDWKKAVAEEVMGYRNDEQNISGLIDVASCCKSNGTEI